MILDNIKNLPKYAAGNEMLLLAYDFIMNYKKQPFPCGRYELDGERCFALVQKYETVPASEKDFESHARYIDLQYVVSGQERMLWASKDGITCTEPMDVQKDIAFYTEKQDYTPCELVVEADEFALFYPQDAHKTGCCAEGPETVEKIVVKVLMN